MSAYENYNQHFLSEVCDEPYYSDADFQEGATMADVVESDMRAAPYAFVSSPEVGDVQPRTRSEFMCLAFIRQTRQGGNE